MEKRKRQIKRGNQSEAKEEWEQKEEEKNIRSRHEAVNIPNRGGTLGDEDIEEKEQRREVRKKRRREQD